MLTTVMDKIWTFMLLKMVLSHLWVERDWLKMLNDEISSKSNTLFDISKKEVKDINVAI